MPSGGGVVSSTSDGVTATGMDDTVVDAAPMALELDERISDGGAPHFEDTTGVTSDNDTVGRIVGDTKGWVLNESGRLVADILTC